MADVAAECGASPRHLNRLMRTWVGYGPKVFGRVVRFQETLEQIRHAPTCRISTELAADWNFDSWPGTRWRRRTSQRPALCFDERPGLSPAQCATAAIVADRVTWQSGRPDEEYGFGRLNVEKLLR